MDISALLSSLQSSDTKLRLNSLTSFHTQLTQENLSLKDVKADVRSKLMNAILEAIDDANPKIIQMALGCLKIFIERYATLFTTAFNAVYAVLINKLSDSKIVIRDVVSEVIISLIKANGLYSGMEKILLQLNHKNANCRESIINIISQLYDNFGDDLKIVVDLPLKLVGMLNDQQPTVRQVAFDTIVKLKSLFGDSLLDTLKATNVKQMYIQQMRNEIEQNSIRPLGGSLVNSTTRPADFLLTMNARYQSPKNRDKVGAKVVEKDADAMPFESNDSDSSFLQIILENPPVQVPSFNSERDLQRNFDNIIANLSMLDDWQARIQALLNLQSLTLEKFDNFVQLLRRERELINAQLSDLRSAVCKEAFRTVAVIAMMLGQNFNILSEYWIPTILRQVAVKIQVISSSADAAIRIIIASTTIGYNKLIPIFIENCINKSAILRKHSLEYIMLACSLWSREVLDKHINALQQIVKNTIGDADQSARKAARQLFWVMMNIDSWTDLMKAILNDMDTIQQKHLHNELQNPSIDLQRSLNYLRTCHSRTMSLALSTFMQHTKDGNAFQIQDIKQTALRPKSVTRGLSGRTLHPSQSETSLQAFRPKSSSTVKRATARLSVLPSDEDSRATATDTTQIVTPEIPPDILPESLPTGFSSRRSSLAAPMRVSQTRSLASLQPRDALNHDAETIAINVPRGNVISSSEFLALSSAGQNHSVPLPPTRISSTASSSREFVVPAPPSASSLGSGAKRVAVGQIVPNKVDSIRNLPVRSVGNVEMNTHTRPPTSSLETVENTLTHDVINAFNSTDPTLKRKSDNQSTGSGSTTLSGKSIGNAIDIDYGEMNSPHVDSDVGMFNTANIRALAADEYWGNRLKAFDLILKRLQDAGNNAASVPSVMVDLILDLSVDHLADQHQKIAADALQILQYFIDNPEFAEKASSKLSSIIVGLFHRLADRRQSIRDHANDLLNSVRQAYDPVAIMTALAPKIVDVPARIRTAVMQFLGVIVPHCESYFLQSSNTAAFLSRMSALLGGSGSNKPSVTLTVAGRRLLELIYKVSPKEVCLQLSMLPLQQQYVMKKLLEITIPDIESIITRYRSVQTIKNSPQSRPDQVRQVDKVIEQIQIPEFESRNEVEIDFYAPVEKENVHSPNSVQVSPKTDASLKESVPTVSSSSRKISATESNFMSPLSRQLSTDIVVLLNSFHPSTTTEDKVQAVHDLRQLIKDESSEEYWSQYTSQVICVLLELFQTSKVQSFPSTCANADRPLTGLSPRPGVNPKDAENMHIACKALTLLVKYKGTHVKRFMDLLVTRLCHAAAYAPITVTITCEQILSDVAVFDPDKYLGLVIPLAATYQYRENLQYPLYNPINSPLQKTSLQQEDTINNSQLRLISLHTMAVAVKHSSSPQLIDRLPVLISAILPSISSSLADLRKAVIMVLVEIYFVIGDALYPFIQDLAAPHRKLLTIYVEKKSEQREMSSSGKAQC